MTYNARFPQFYWSVSESCAMLRLHSLLRSLLAIFIFPLVILLIKQVAQLVHSVFLQRWQQMRIGVQRDGNAAMPQGFLYYFRVHGHC